MLTEVSRRFGRIPPESDDVEITFLRNVNGLTVWAKAPIIEDFFSGLVEPSRVDRLVDSRLGMKVYNVKAPEVPGAAFDPKQAGIFTGGMFNMTFLAAHDLRQGIEFKCTGLFSDATIENLRRVATAAIVHLTTNYIRPLEVGTVIRWERRSGE